jgi:polygalacturonase
MMKIKTLLPVLIAVALCACHSNKTDFDIRDYGAEGDSVTDNAEAIQKAIDACHEAGGGRVIIPGDGVYMTGPFTVASYVDLHLEAHARLLANPDEKVYKKSAFRDNRGEGMMWISGENVEQFSISGKGMIDGNGVAFMGKELSDSYELKPVHEFDPRPHVLTLIKSKNIRISDVTVGQSAYWTLHFAGCEDVTVDNVSILNNLKIRNGDGMDIDHSRNVRVSNCLIRSGDDCICLKNRREYSDMGPCENIVVTNCIMTSRSCAFKIGSENMDRIKHVMVDNCIIKDSNRGIGIQNRDEGTVEDVVFSNIHVDCNLFSNVWWGKAEPIYVTAYARKAGDHKDAGWRFPKGMTDYQVGVVSDIHFNNIVCDSENGAYIGADTKDRLQHLYFDQVDMLISKKTNYPGGIYDKRPCKGDEFFSGKTYGFLVDNASGVTIRNCSVRWGDTRPPYFASTIYSQNVDGLVTFNLK